MTKDRVNALLAYIIAIYPKFVSPNKIEIKLWYELLEPIDAEDVNLAIKEWYATSKFYPHLSDILNLVKKQKVAQLPSPEMAYQIAVAVSRGDEVEVHPAIEATIRKFGGRQALKSGEVKMHYVRADFLNAYGKVIDEHIDEGKALLPPPSKQIDYADEALKRLKKELEERLERED